MANKSSYHRIKIIYLLIPVLFLQYLGSTVVKELRGTESTKKSIQKLKKSTKEPRDSPDIILSISYRGVKFLNTITRVSINYTNSFFLLITYITHSVLHDVPNL